MYTSKAKTNTNMKRSGILPVQRGEITLKPQIKIFSCKGSFSIKNKTNFPKGRFWCCYQENSRNLLLLVFDFIVKEKMHGQFIYLHESNIFETYQNLKKIYAMKLI